MYSFGGPDSAYASDENVLLARRMYLFDAKRKKIVKSGQTSCDTKLKSRNLVYLSFNQLSKLYRNRMHNRQHKIAGICSTFN